MGISIQVTPVQISRELQYMFLLTLGFSVALLSWRSEAWFQHDLCLPLTRIPPHNQCKKREDLAAIRDPGAPVIDCLH